MMGIRQQLEMKMFHKGLVDLDDEEDANLIFQLIMKKIVNTI